MLGLAGLAAKLHLTQALTNKLLASPIEKIALRATLYENQTTFARLANLSINVSSISKISW